MAQPDPTVQPPVTAGLNALLSVIDSHPHGFLGFMLAESQAQDKGKLNEFHKGLERLLEKSYVPIDDDRHEPFRPFVLDGRVCEYDPVKKTDKHRHRVFPVTLPHGILYTDRARFAAGDYARLALLKFDSLVLNVYPGCPEHLLADIQRDCRRINAKRGQSFQC